MDEIKIEEINIDNDDDISQDGYFYDFKGNLRNAFEEVKKAEEYLEARQEAIVQFRWYKNEVTRIKKIAAKKGLKYQSYIKMVLKQTMDQEELFS